MANRNGNRENNTRRENKNENNDIIVIRVMINSGDIPDSALKNVGNKH